jgi:hypothetical protein
MKLENDRSVGVALRTYQAYLYSVVIIANGAQPYSAEAELWWNRPADEGGGRWHYFRRCVDMAAEDAVRCVERDFKVWAQRQRHATGS